MAGLPRDTALLCARCAQLAGSPLQHACHSCGGPLELRAPLEYFAPGPGLGIGRYLKSFPVTRIVSLGEPETPLVEVGHDGALLGKLDSLLPTGSFKDRGSAVMVAWLAEHGAKRIIIDSSGNAGASVAAYAARHGIACTVFVPATASAGKLTQIELYGAQIVRVEGTREDCAAAALAASSWEEGVVYGSHAWSPLFLRGTATFAFEIVERFGSAPEAIVIPLGAGTLFLGAALGFQAMKRAGLIDRVPRMIGVQSTACAPLADAFARGGTEGVPTVADDTAAEGVKTGNPPRGREILEVARKTDGAITTAKDEELWAALALVGLRGVNAEPTAALAVAGALALQRRGELGSKSVVIAITGSGLKASPAIREALFSGTSSD